VPDVEQERDLRQRASTAGFVGGLIISNGVSNLSPRKARVLPEACRILRPGGRLAIVDLILDHDLPPEIQTHPAAWAGCLSGALSEVALYKGVRRAGFREASITPIEPFGLAEGERPPGRDRG
jgi:SAM-dependent methyltransferase